MISRSFADATLDGPIALLLIAGGILAFVVVMLVLLLRGTPEQPGEQAEPEPVDGPTCDVVRPLCRREATHTRHGWKLCTPHYQDLVAGRPAS